MGNDTTFRQRQTAAPANGSARADRNPSARKQMNEWSGVYVDPADFAVRPFIAFANMLARYHRYRVKELDRLGRVIESGRRVIVVSNHALDLIDPLLLLSHVLERYHRIPRFIGHENLIFHIPGLSTLASTWRVIPSRQPQETAEALDRDRFLMLFPGSGTEALMRDYHHEPYRLKWQDRTGFVRLALEHDADILFAATVGNDDMYYQSRIALPDAYLRFVNAGDAERYRGARLQFGLFGPHLLPAFFPLPVKLTHIISEPLDLGDRERALNDNSALERLHEDVWSQCQNFLDAAVSSERADTDWLDQTVLNYAGFARRLGL